MITHSSLLLMHRVCFFFNDTATTEIYTLSLHDALPISIPTLVKPLRSVDLVTGEPGVAHRERTDSCVVPAAGVIGEAMLALVLADAILEKFGGDHLQQVQKHLGATGQYLRTFSTGKLTNKN